MSIRTFYLFLVFFFALGLNANAQKVDHFATTRKAVLEILRNHINGAKIKDSTAIYSFSIKISVRQQAKKLLVKTEINNSEAKSFFEGLEQLKKIDYSSLMNGKKQASFVVSAYILVYGSKYNNEIKLSTIPTALKYLFVENELGQQNLGSVLIELDKKVYN